MIEENFFEVPEINETKLYNGTLVYEYTFVGGIKIRLFYDSHHELEEVSVGYESIGGDFRLRDRILYCSANTFAIGTNIDYTKQIEKINGNIQSNNSNFLQKFDHFYYCRQDIHNPKYSTWFNFYTQKPSSSQKYNNSNMIISKKFLITDFEKKLNEKIKKDNLIRESTSREENQVFFTASGVGVLLHAREDGILESASLAYYPEQRYSVAKKYDDLCYFVANLLLDVNEHEWQTMKNSMDIERYNTCIRNGYNIKHTYCDIFGHENTMDFTLLG